LNTPKLQFASYINYQPLPDEHKPPVPEVLGDRKDRYFTVIGATQDKVAGTNQGHPIIVTFDGNGKVETVCVVDNAAPDSNGNATMNVSYGYAPKHRPMLHFTNGRMDIGSTNDINGLLHEFDPPNMLGESARDRTKDLKAPPLTYQAPGMKKPWEFPKKSLVPPSAPTPVPSAPDPAPPTAPAPAGTAPAAPANPPGPPDNPPAAPGPTTFRTGSMNIEVPRVPNLGPIFNQGPHIG
jgi:hypothetical protein